MTLLRMMMVIKRIKRMRMMFITLVPSSSRFLQLFGHPTTTVLGFIPPRPVVWGYRGYRGHRGYRGYKGNLQQVKYSCCGEHCAPV